jgi:hypothetical protein
MVLLDRENPKRLELALPIELGATSGHDAEKQSEADQSARFQNSPFNPTLGMMGRPVL